MDAGSVAARTAPRAGLDWLGPHLEAAYGIAVTGVRELDLGVLRVERGDGQPWIARVFPAGRAVEQAEGDAAVLRLLAERGYPAERPAAEPAVSVLHGQAVVVTEHVASVPRERRRDAVRAAGGLRALGAMLAILHRVGDEGHAAGRPGGAWHHVADGGPPAELAAVRALLDGAEERVAARELGAYGALQDALEELDDGRDLPEGLIHPDFALANVVAAPGGELVVVDWAGAGRGPRAWALAFLLWSAAFGGDLARAERVAAGYGRRVDVQPEELERLAGLVLARPVVFEAWMFATGRRPLADAAAGLAPARERAEAIAAHAVATLR